MKHIISVGQTYQPEDGDEFEVVKVGQDGVTSATSSGDIIHMDLDDFIGELEEGVLLPVVYEDTEDEVDDANEDVQG